MKILNPIYDNAFKYLMDNEQIAKIVLSIILDTKILSLQSRPQETPLSFGGGGINISRFDFKAVIATPNDEQATVLIEIQKYKTPNPIGRFRNYLARSYMKEESSLAENGEKIKYLPIISIYILGFDLPEFSCRAIRIDNNPYDIVNQKAIEVKSDFVNLLTHRSFILLACPKKGVKNQNTQLEKFLNLFIQKLKGEDPNTIIEVNLNKENDNELQLIVDYLKQATMNEELLRKVNAEKDFYQSIEQLEKETAEAKEREKEANAIAEQERLEKEKAKKREEEAKEREEEAKEREEEAKEREKQILINSVIALKQSGLSYEQIARSLNIDINIIEKIK